MKSPRKMKNASIKTKLPRSPVQASFLLKERQDYGGELRKKAKNRRARPLAFKSGTMHIVLRSLQARGEFSFLHRSKKTKVDQFIQTFSSGKGVQILRFANVGNHIHLHVKLVNRRLYVAWIRGLSSGLAMLALGRKGLAQLKQQKLKFWNHRPYSKVIQNFKQELKTQNYIEINILEALGYPRIAAEALVLSTYNHILKPKRC